MTPTASTTRCSAARERRCVAALIALALSTAAQAEALRVVTATRGAGDAVELTLRFEPAPRVIEALDATVPLCFEVQFSPQPADSTRLCLTHAPLYRDYALYRGNTERRFRLRTELFSAFEQQRIDAPAHVRAVRVRLDHGVLPPPMRLPATFQRAWRLDTGWVRLQ
jgi:hypothetical protein